MFTISVISTARKSANFLTRDVGIRSNDEDFEGPSLMTATVSRTVSPTKEDKGGNSNGVSAAGWQQRAGSSMDWMLANLVVNWPLNRSTSSCRESWWGSLRRLLDEKEINHPEERFLTKRFAYYFIEVGRLR